MCSTRQKIKLSKENIEKGRSILTGEYAFDQEKKFYKKD
jgi:hypothetical protein